MKPKETISEMIACFTFITNGLKALDKEYSNMELVRKILRSLPLVWHTKATMIEDSKNLSTLTLEELIGSLMTYELNMQRSEPESKKSKGIALKASSHKQNSTSEDDSGLEDDEAQLDLLTRRMKKFFKKCRLAFSSNGKRSRKKSHTRGISSKEKEVLCYECKRPGHMRGECLEMLKKFKNMKEKKMRAMVAT